MKTVYILLLSFVISLCGCNRQGEIRVMAPDGFTGLINVYEDDTVTTKSLITIDASGYGRMQNPRQIKNWNKYIVTKGNQPVPDGALDTVGNLGFYLVGETKEMTAFFIGSRQDRLALEKDSPKSLYLPAAKRAEDIRNEPKTSYLEF